MENLNEKIKTFLKKYGTLVRKKETSSYVELMMDDHWCCTFEGKSYYIPDNCSDYTEEDDEIYDILQDEYHYIENF